ncbi:MAG: hypothetical protein OHK0046_18220 [Anaerolineae bacterium]
MEQVKSPWIRAGIHAALLVWVLFSVTPFVMGLIGSTQVTRDATARNPRFMPQSFIDNNILIALLLGGIILLAFWFIVRKQIHPVSTAQLGLVAVILVVVCGGFIHVTNTIDEDYVYNTTWQNYEELWLSVEPEDFAPVGFGLIGLVILLVGIGVYASRFPKLKVRVYFGIAAVIVATVILLPRVVQMAEFYDFFMNSVIVTAGTLLISITIGCLAGYGLARYSGISSFVILFAALGFRALPRMAFILPYYYFAQISGLYDTYTLLIITFVAINQPFTIWMLRSFFMDIPHELEEAAMIDGCNRFTGFFRIIIPIVWPGIITTALFTLLLAYNEFLLARLLTSQNWTLPVGIARFTSGEDTRLIPLSNASAISITVPIVIIIIFFQRYLIKGLAGGAVKG